jgi:hypothetical protein
MTCHTTSLRTDVDLDVGVALARKIRYHVTRPTHSALWLATLSVVEPANATTADWENYFRSTSFVSDLPPFLNPSVVVLTSLWVGVLLIGYGFGYLLALKAYSKTWTCAGGHRGNYFPATSAVWYCPFFAVRFFVSSFLARSHS